MRHLPLILLVCVVGGCSSTPSKPTLMANAAKEEITVYQLRAMDYEYASHFAQLVSACATDIAAESPTKEHQYNAYQWRMWASPQARAAAFDQDPFAGMLELWVLSIQQRQYFTEGLGRFSFGESETCASDTTRLLERDAELLAAQVMPDATLDNLSKAVREWADEHPIEGELYVRPTARADLASLFSSEKQGGLKAVGSIEDTLRDMNDRITILTVQMPVEARWQAEFLVNSLFDDRFQEPADSVVGAVDDITEFLGDFGLTLGEQTSALLDGFEVERVAVFDAIEKERQMILEAIEQERISILDDLDNKLRSTTEELDSVGKGLIDHFFKRLIQVLIGMGIFVLLVVAIVLFAARRRRNDED